MSAKDRTNIIVLIVYLLFLFWIIALRGQFSVNPVTILPQVNIIPFYYPNRLPNEVSIMDSIANILFYFPLGYIIRWVNLNLKKRWEILIIVLVGFFLNLSRFSLKTGNFDMTDIIICTIGGIIGLYVYTIAQETLPPSDKHNKTA